MAVDEERRESEAGSSWVRRLPWLRLVAEFGVIFLGVSLSLLADDWRQSRIDGHEEIGALEELLSDLQADYADLDSVRTDLMRHERDGAWVFQRLGQAGVDADSVALRLASLHELNLYKAPRATYTGLRSSGRISLIRDRDLRRAMVQYYEERQPYLLQFRETYSDLWVAFTDAIALDAEVYYPDGVEGSFLQGLAFRLKRPWVDIPSDSSFRYKFTTMGILASILTVRYGEALNENEALQASIRASLAR